MSRRTPMTQIRFIWSVVLFLTCLAALRSTLMLSILLILIPVVIFILLINWTVKKITS